MLVALPTARIVLTDTRPKRKRHKYRIAFSIPNNVAVGKQQSDIAVMQNFLSKLIDNQQNRGYNHIVIINMYLWLNWIELPATDRTVGGSNPFRYAKATLRNREVAFLLRTLAVLARARACIKKNSVAGKVA